MRTLSPGPSGLWDRARVAWMLAGLLRRQFLIKCRAHVQAHDGGPARTADRRPAGLEVAGSTGARDSRPAAPNMLRMLRTPFRKLRAVRGFLRRMSAHNRQLVRLCATALDEAASRGCREVVLYGGGDAARLLSTLSSGARVRTRAVCPFGHLSAEGKRGETELWPEERLAGWNGPVIVAAFVNVERRLERLRELGIPEDRLITMPALDAV